MISFRALFIAILLLLPAASGSGSVPQTLRSDADMAAETSGAPPPISSGCMACHPYDLAAHQDLSCTSCHDGNDQASTREVAHLGLTAAPAAPAHLQKKCASCHALQTVDIDHSRHFTLTGEINPVRRHFGADQDLASALEIPLTDEPDSPLALADDLLRRRCLRCHVYYRGDDYRETRRGTGCAACHLDYQDGKLISHRFQASPDDRRCLACHYGNRVGGDYYGFFEHDYKDEYRTPFLTSGSYPDRSYGVERHRLQPDVHRQAGLVCLDCHGGLHRGGATTIGCAACHGWRPGEPLPAENLRAENDQLWMQIRGEGKRVLGVPRATDPAHARYGGKVDCAVCHARWGYDDRGTHLLRTDAGDYQDWADLIVQGSSEVESQLLTNLYGDREVEPNMTDKLTGTVRPGLWLKAYELRRWEEPPLGRDSQGRLRVVRPSLDLHLSWVDEEGLTVFDSSGGRGPELRPYTPHTVGKAGPFYWQRLKGFNPETLPGAPGK